MGKKKRPSIKKYLIWALCLALIAFMGIFIFFNQFPKFFSLSKYPPLSSCLKSSNSGAKLCKKNPFYYSLKDISPYMLEAVVLTEDEKFFNHKGFDWKEIQKSFKENIKARSYKRGGSTITQQLVKNIYLSSEKSLIRKIKEAQLATQIEKKYSKKLILEKYLNAIEYGRNLYGIGRASKYYFGKQPSNLNILESLYLAILLPSPKKYSQSFKERKLTNYQEKRIKTLIKRLRRKGVIDKAYSADLISRIKNFPWDIKQKSKIKEIILEVDQENEDSTLWPGSDKIEKEITSDPEIEKEINLELKSEIDTDEEIAPAAPIKEVEADLEDF